MLPQTRKHLALFVEKADSLRQKSLSQHALRDGLTVTLRLNTSGGNVKRVLPSQEQIESAIVTLRLFVQGNDAISLKKIETLMTDPGLSSTWKDHFQRKNEQLNTYFDNKPPIGIGGYSNRAIFDTFVYGDIAHTDSKHRPTYEKWTRLPIYPFIEQIFISIVMDIVFLIGEIADMTRLELSDNNQCEG